MIIAGYMFGSLTTLGRIKNRDPREEPMMKSFAKDFRVILFVLLLVLVNLWAHHHIGPSTWYYFIDGVVVIFVVADPERIGRYLPPQSIVTRLTELIGRALKKITKTCSLSVLFGSFLLSVFFVSSVWTTKEIHFTSLFRHNHNVVVSPLGSSVGHRLVFTSPFGRRICMHSDGAFSKPKVTPIRRLVFDNVPSPPIVVVYIAERNFAVLDNTVFRVTKNGRTLHREATIDENKKIVASFRMGGRSENCRRVFAEDTLQRTLDAWSYPLVLKGCDSIVNVDDFVQFHLVSQTGDVMKTIEYRVKEGCNIVDLGVAL